VVPAWTLLAALAAGLILGTIGSRFFFRPAAPPPTEESPPPPPEAAEPVASPPPPPPPPPEPEPEPARISMEDVVSELERRYQGRQADSSAEKRPGTKRRRPAK
jgi:hypothetical protein